jgi:hypothetical protein
MSKGAHVHHTGALCAECCKQIASPKYRAVQKIGEGLLVAQQLVDQVADNVGDRLETLLKRPSALDHLESEDLEIFEPAARQDFPVDSISRLAPAYERQNLVEEKNAAKISPDSAPEISPDTARVLEQEELEQEEPMLLRDSTGASRAVGLGSLAMLMLPQATKAESEFLKDSTVSESDSEEALPIESKASVEIERPPTRPTRDWNALIARTLPIEEPAVGQVARKVERVPKTPALPVSEGALQENSPKVPLKEQAIRTYPVAGEVEPVPTATKRLSSPLTDKEPAQALLAPHNYFWEEVKENLLVIVKALWYLAELVGIGVFGTAMLLVSFFPTALRPRTPEEFDAYERDRLASKKKKQEEWEKDREEWEEKQRAAGDEHNTKALHFWTDYEYQRRAIDQIGNQVPESRNLSVASVEAPHIWQIESQIKRVELNGDDHYQQRRLTEELQMLRAQQQTREKRRDELWVKMRDLESTVNRCLTMAKMAANAENWQQADDHMREAHQIYRKAEDTWRDYFAV